MKKIIIFILIISTMIFFSCENSNNTILSQPQIDSSTYTEDDSPIVSESPDTVDDTTSSEETTEITEEGTYNKEYSGRY